MNYAEKDQIRSAVRDINEAVKDLALKLGRTANLINQERTDEALESLKPVISAGAKIHLVLKGLLDLVS